jgi:crossover junction endodeoxyribonuclease RuvC
VKRILGIDPGSQATGFGLIETAPGNSRALLYGTIRPPRGLSLPDRLLTIHRDLAAVIAEHEPDVVAVETAFYHKNARSTLVLGHVRGVVLLAGVPVHEYAPREIKLAVTGNGNASKDQVGFMIRGLLALREIPAADAADALAAALCHVQRGGARVHP